MHLGQQMRELGCELVAQWTEGIIRNRLSRRPIGIKKKSASLDGTFHGSQDKMLYTWIGKTEDLVLYNTTAPWSVLQVANGSGDGFDDPLKPSSFFRHRIVLVFRALVYESYSISRER